MPVPGPPWTTTMPGQGRPDDLVLLPLDGGHDVGHPPRARPLEGGQQRPLAHQDQVVVGGLGGEQLVVEAGDRPPPEDEVAAADQAHRRPRRGPVERLRGRGPPVDHQGLVVLVGDGHPADVAALAAGGVGAPEDQPRLAHLERRQAPLGELHPHVALEAGLVGAAGRGLDDVGRHGAGRVPHGLQAGVGAVDDRLFGLDLGMATWWRVLCGGEREPSSVTTPAAGSKPAPRRRRSGRLVDRSTVRTLHPGASACR